MKVVYLDQNKWIELARAVKAPDRYPETHALLDSLVPQLERGELVFPLSDTNIYETFKVNDPDRRHDLAIVQATISGGTVIRGRHARLEAEVGQFLRGAYGLPLAILEKRWFLSDVFIEATMDLGDPRAGKLVPALVANVIKKQPAEALYHYLVTSSEATRKEAVALFSAGSADLARRIEVRRQAHAAQPRAMRAKLYNAQLMIDEMDILRDIAQRAGIGCNHITDIGAQLAQRLVEEVPLYNIERELALRLESQTRPIEENDFRDMKAFCAAIPYADLIIGEKQFVSLARQANLHKKYQARLSTDLRDIAKPLH